MARAAVLIVDDSVTIRAVIEQLLLDDPRFDVAGIASNITEARRLMRSNSHDVVTLDLAMPGIGGIEFLDELVDRPHAPVVVVSSSTISGSSSEEEALAHGAFGCFDKAKILSNASGFLRMLMKASSTKKR